MLWASSLTKQMTTSGISWERTRKMGINTLAFRLCQHRTFFDVDADCLGVTGKIPWAQNRQWAELLAQSGTPFLASIKPGIFSASVVSEAILKGADWCGNHPGYDTDKSAAIPSHPGEKLHVPIPDDSPWSYELRVRQVGKL